MSYRRRPQIDLVDHIPAYIKQSLSKDNIYQLASIIKEQITIPQAPMGEVTYSGNRITGYNSVLNGYSAMGYYNTSDLPMNVLETMRRDSQVALGMAIVKYPITNLGFNVNCKNEIVKDFVKKVLKKNWSKILRSCLLSLDYGFVAFEKVWNNAIYDINPGLHQRKIRNEKFIVLDKLKPLHPSTISLRLDDKNNVMAVIQNSFKKNPIVLDKQKSMIITYQEEFGNWFGKSRLVTAYEAWYWKIISTQFFLRWMERHSIPPYIVRHPKGMVIQRDGTQIDANEIAFQMSQAMSSYGNLSIPSEMYKPEEGGGKKWDLDVLNPGTQTLTLDTVVEKVWNLAILRGLLIPDKTSLSGLDSEIATKIFLSTLEDVKQTIEETLNEEIVKPLVYWNFDQSEIEDCTLNIDEIDFEKRQEMRKLLSKILDMSATWLKQRGGLPFKTLPDMDKLYEILDIPPTDIALHTFKTIGPNGEEIIKNDNEPSKGTTGPDKGELTSGNQSRIGRNGTPRDEDKEDESVI